MSHNNGEVLAEVGATIPYVGGIAIISTEVTSNAVVDNAQFMCLLS